MPGRLPAIVAGLFAMAPLVAYLGWSAFGSASLSIRTWQLPVPSPRISAWQVVASVADLAFAAAALFVLLPDSAQVSYAAFLAVFVLAAVASAATGIPGGLGVIEYVVVLALPGVPTAELLGRLLAFRLVYYVMPLAIAAALLAVHEFRQHRDRLGRAAGLAGTWLTAVAPQALGTLAFIGGAVLLLSGATPAIASRVAGLERWLPLSVLEASHLLGSVAGLGLVILSRSLFRRVHEAWLLATVVALAGAVLSLLKGFDYEEALILVGVAGLLWLGRGAFNRKGKVMEQRFTPQWVLGLAVVILFITWVGMLAHRHVEYTSDLWWTFGFNAPAPRMLRASLVVTAIAVAFVANESAVARRAACRGDADDGTRARATDARAVRHRDGIARAARRQAIPVPPDGRCVRDVPGLRAELDRDGRPRRRPVPRGGAGLGVPRTVRPSRRVERVLRGAGHLDARSTSTWDSRC